MFNKIFRFQRDYIRTSTYDQSKYILMEQQNKNSRGDQFRVQLKLPYFQHEKFSQPRFLSLNFAVWFSHRQLHYQDSHEDTLHSSIVNKFEELKSEQRRQFQSLYIQPHPMNIYHTCSNYMQLLKIESLLVPIILGNINISEHLQP